MLKILLVEDNAEKAQSITNAILQIPNILEEDVSCVSDIIHAKRELTSNDFDLLLLDILIPNRFDQSPQKEGGLKFLRDIQVSHRLSLPLHIIGITAYADVYDTARNIFEQELWALIKYERESTEWVSKLQNKIKYIINCKKKLRWSDNVSYDYDLAVVTALRNPELEAILRLAQWEEIHTKNDATNVYSTIFTSGEKKIRVIAASSSQMGMTAMSVLVCNLIMNFRPRYLALLGLTAGIKGRTNLGDIIVANPSWDFNSGKFEVVEGNSVFSHEPKQIILSPELHSKFEAMIADQELFDGIKQEWPANKPDTSLHLVIGPLASGGSVVADSSLVERIKEQNRKLLGIDMETYASLYSAFNCLKPRPQAFAMKAVSDFANEEKVDTFREYAAFTCAKALIHFATNYLDY